MADTTDMSGKMTPEGANLQEAPVACQTCAYYMGPDIPGENCAMVHGHMEPLWVCEHWEPQDSEDVSQAG